LEDLVYIVPSFTIKAANNKKSFFLDDGVENYGYEINKTLTEWKDNVGKYCVKNDILTLAFCVGLSGPLLKFFPVVGTTIVNLTGKSSIGKTTVLHVAASLWGSSRKFIQQWRTTSNALEAVAESHNDSLLILDELG
jgi:putative DNA primase/helicase